MLAERAKQYIKSHGFEAFDTADGLIAIMPARGPDMDEGLPRFSTVALFSKAEEVLPGFDCWFDELHVFPVHFEPSPKDGFAEAHVDGREVRSWLGY